MVIQERAVVSGQPTALYSKSWQRAPSRMRALAVLENNPGFRFRSSIWGLRVCRILDEKMRLRFLADAELICTWIVLHGSHYKLREY